MCLSLLASVLVLQASTVEQEVWAQKLGKERSNFGDIPNSGLWKHGYTGQFGGTYILYRAGSSTERYYFTVSPGAVRSRISRVTRVGENIRKDWMISIEKGADSRIIKPGPLWIWAGKGKIVGAVPKQAISDLQNQDPLAMYHSNVHFSYCAFIFPDGKESEYIAWEAGVETAGGGYSFAMLPKTHWPYPVTVEERRYAYPKSKSGLKLTSKSS